MLIINGKILTMAEKEYDQGYVCVTDGKITSTGDMKGLPSDTSISKKDSQEEILDVDGAWVMPGLIDAHCHVGISEEKWGTVTDDCNESRFWRNSKGKLWTEGPNAGLQNGNRRYAAGGTISGMPLSG